MNIVTALHCEARPLIDFFALKCWSEAGGFQIYRSDKVSLIVSGIGKLSAATAVGYLQSLSPHKCWLNVGVAGHRNATLGSPFLANAIHDSHLERTLYPAFVFTPPCPTASVMTVDRPENDYMEDSLYEMEAYGFHRAATRFTTIELVHCLKIVSDNPSNPTHQVNKAKVTGWITEQIPLIEKIYHELNGLHPTHEVDLAPYLERWHFTVTQRHSLRTLLEKWHAISGEYSAWDSTHEQMKESKEVLRYLDFKIKKKPLKFQNVSNDLH